MSINIQTPWHKSSYTRFVYETLPKLLAERLPLASYQVEVTLPDELGIFVELDGGANARYARLPWPDDQGIFNINDQPYVFVLTASTEDLDRAEIACVGEMLFDSIQQRIGQASNGVIWDQELLLAWLPLDRWIGEFFQSKAQRLDTTNWLSRHTHLRRLIIPTMEQVITPGQFGRVCPFETPEGPNIGRIFTIAAGAEIQDGRLVIIDDRPEAGLGISASMLPFLEHNDPNRLLMAANQNRWSLPAPDPEPALVQTGNEPDAPDFWCGRNLLTVFMSLGERTTQDAIVLSMSAAQRLGYPVPIQPGDRLNDRHGLKGVVSEILPDDQMPHLPDGTPVELVYGAFGVPTRLILGPVREAVMGRIARHESQPAIVPPFDAPGENDLLQRLERSGLPAPGTEYLTLGKDGPTCELPSTTGWVYWNRSVHRASEKMAVLFDEDNLLTFGELEFQALKTCDAVENLKDAFSTRSARRSSLQELQAQVARGVIVPSDEPFPWFKTLAAHLEAAGIQMQIEDGRLSFQFATPAGAALKLAKPLPHPWLHEVMIDTVGVLECEPYTALVEANNRLTKALANHAPSPLIKSASDLLAASLEAYFDSLLPTEGLSMGGLSYLPQNAAQFICGLGETGEPQLFGARTVAAPALPGMYPDQVGLPEEVAWALFAPQLTRELGQEPVDDRSATAAALLEEIMAHAWVIINRTPTVMPTALMAFHPVRGYDQVIRLHPLVCEMMNTDFDGDQLAVYLPLSDAAQREAGEKLSLEGHLRRDPSLARTLLSQPEALWGLAWLALQPDGKQQVAELFDVKPALLPEPLTQSDVRSLLETMFAALPLTDAIDRAVRLSRLGYQVAEASGVSFHPFIDRGLHLPAMPESDHPAAWPSYLEELTEALRSNQDYKDVTHGPHLLAARIRARNRRALPWLVGPRGPVVDASGKTVIVRHSLTQGLSPTEMFACVAGARRGLLEVIQEMTPPTHPAHQRQGEESWSVLARARRSRHPGIVFARAAASGEIDPLSDFDSRLFTGLL